jgi:hypothetical protein
VFDSRRGDLALPLVRHDAGPGVCDYAVASRDETMRQAIRLSSAWLRPIETTGRFLIYRVERPPARSEDVPE